MAYNSTTTWQSEFLADREANHPWYGGCDGLAADGGCAECAAVRFEPGYAEGRAAWWGEFKKASEADHERRERRKARRRARAIARMDREVEIHVG